MSTDSDNNKGLIKGPSLGYTDNFPEREMWREISEMFNGQFKIKHNSGNELEIHNISIPHKNWIINISVSDTRPLKFEANFNAIQEFELIISWEGFIERIYKWFGKKEIEIGWKKFDSFYFLECNKTQLLRGLITSDIQKTLLKYKVYSVIYHTDIETNKSKIISVIRRRAGSKSSIIELINMYKSLFDNLENLTIIK